MPRCYGTRTMYAIAVSGAVAWRTIDRRYRVSYRQMTEDKNALYLAILGRCHVLKTTAWTSINSTIIKPLNKDAGKNVNGTPKYDNFNCTCTRSLRKIPGQAYQSDSDYYKVYYWYEVPDGYRQKSLAEQEKTLRKLQLLNASTKSSWQILWARYKLRTIIKRYNDLVLQHQKIWAISSDLMSFIRPMNAWNKEDVNYLLMFRKSNRSLRIFRNVTRSRRNGVK
jgi:hypothetical protein